jgi:hypothetical protein
MSDTRHQNNYDRKWSEKKKDGYYVEKYKNYLCNLYNRKQKNDTLLGHYIKNINERKRRVMIQYIRNNFYYAKNLAQRKEKP